MNKDSSGSKRDLRVDCTRKPHPSDASGEAQPKGESQTRRTYVDEAEGLTEWVSE